MAYLCGFFAVIAEDSEQVVLFSRISCGKPKWVRQIHAPVRFKLIIPGLLCVCRGDHRSPAGTQLIVYTQPKPPLCKGRCLAEAEGLFGANLLFYSKLN